MARCARNGPSAVTKVAPVSTVRCTETGTSPWPPWILLALLIPVSQAFLWGFYVAYYVSEEELSGLIPDYE